MPLPSLRLHSAKQCRARSKRSGNQCLNPAAFGMPTCRMHGARHPDNILRGEEHPAYKHGQETTEMRKDRALASARLALLEQVGYAIGLLSGRRTRGRKPSRMEDVYPELHTILVLCKHIA